VGVGATCRVVRGGDVTMGEGQAHGNLSGGQVSERAWAVWEGSKEANSEGRVWISGKE
jgi:hypothetical protein